MRGIRQRAGALPLGGPGVAGTLTLHLAVVVTLLAAGAARRRPTAPIAYRVTLVAAPAPAAAPSPSGAEGAQPAAPAPRTAEPARGPAPTPSRAAPAPQGPAPPQVAAAEGAPSRAAAAAGPAPPATGQPGGAGTDPATIRTEGVEFPFPGYLRNLVAQVYQRWRPPPSQAALVAEVFFFLHRDGSVTGLQFIRRSGSFAFDLEAQGAVESAARAGAFGELPDGFGPDVLPVSFFFNPRGR